MSSVAATRPEEGAHGLGDVIEGLIMYVFGLAAVVLPLAAAFNLTWNAVAALVGPLDRVGGYWTCVLVMLGGYIAWEAIDAMRSRRVADLEDGLAGSVLFAGKMGLVALAAYVIANYLV